MARSIWGFRGCKKKSRIGKTSLNNSGVGSGHFRSRPPSADYHCSRHSRLRSFYILLTWSNYLNSIWASFSSAGPGSFVKIKSKFVKEKYLDILNDHLLPFVEEWFGQNSVNFVHDNSPIHKANMIKTWCDEHPQINALPWPSKGADLYLIDNVWSDIVRHYDFKGRTAPNADAVFKWRAIFGTTSLLIIG